jgi:copper transport protein
LTVVATVAAVLLQGVYGAGLALGDAFHWTLIHSVIDTQFGYLSILRLVIAVAWVPLLRRLLRPESAGRLPKWGAPLAGALATIVASTLAWSGHAHTGRLTWLAVPADVVHVLALTTWLGGLAVLAYALFPGHRLDELREAVPRFSRTAVACVSALVVSGSFQSWRQVGSLHALTTTTYGRILMVKLFLVVLLIVLGAMSRQIADWLFSPRDPIVAGGSDDDGRSGSIADVDLEDDEELEEAFEYRRLRRSVRCEVVIAVAVLAVTTLLVDAVPAKVAATASVGGATGVTLKSDKVWVDITAAPGFAPGANDLHVSVITPAGAPFNAQDLTATLDFPSRHIAPLTIPLRKLGPGHYLSPGFTVPLKGNWRITANVGIDAFTEITLPGTLTFN